MFSDAVLLALIATITPTVASTVALIIALRTGKKLALTEKYNQGAQDGRKRKQRKTDRPRAATTTTK